MKKNIVALFLCALISCNDEIPKNKIRVIAEKDIPSDILNLYTRKIDLKPLQEETKKYELRIWQVFRNDSFPRLMKRIWVEDSVLKRQLYFFEPMIKASKWEGYERKNLTSLSSIPLDSLTKSYNIGSLYNFDTTVVQKLNSNGLLNFTATYFYMEQLSDSNYTGLFIHSPLVFQELNDHYAFLARTYNFVTDKLFLSDSSAAAWLEKKEDLLRAGSAK